MKQAEIVVLSGVRAAALPPEDPAERARLLSLWLDLGMSMRLDELSRAVRLNEQTATFRRVATYR